MKELEHFLTRMREKEIVINHIQVYHRDVMIASYDRMAAKTRLNTYSVSKSVTSIGVGIAIGEGLLHPEDRLDEIFPEYEELRLSPIVGAVRVRDLLTMRCGLKDRLFFSDDPERYRIKDWVRYFMKSEFAYPPGTHFAYSNFNTYMLSCAVERRAGHTLSEYMKPRFFEKIGIGNADWLTCPMGHNTAANGLLLTIDEMSRIGLFLLHGGVWEGEQILPASYLREATVNQIDRDMPKYGYGYQFWINPDGKSYRADGKYGQYIIVLPEKELVITMLSLDDKKFFEDVWSDLVLPIQVQIDTGGSL